MRMIELPPEAVAAIERGRKIEAIAHVRVHTGLGLKEAKEAVDAYIARNPVLRAQLQRDSADRLRRSVVWLLVIAAVVVAAWQWLLPH